MLVYFRVWILKIGVSAIIIINLFGCEAPKKNNDTESYQDAQYLTGELNDNGIPYVKDPLLVYDEDVGNDSNSVATVKNFKLSDTSLSMNLKNISAYRFSHKMKELVSLKDLKSQAVNFGSESLIIHIETFNETTQKNETQNFLINKLEKNNQGFHFKNIEEISNSGYVLSGEISDSEKKDSYVGKYELIFNKNSKEIIKAKFYQRFYFANIHISKANEENSELMSKIPENFKSGNLFAIVSSWTILGGSSFRNIKIISDLSKQFSSVSQYSNEEIERLKVVAEFSSPSIRTAGLSPEGFPINTSGENKISLLGLDENTGEQLYSVSDKDKRIYIEVTNVPVVNSENLVKKNIEKHQADNQSSIISENEQINKNEIIIKKSRSALFQSNQVEVGSFSDKIVMDLNENLKIQKVKDLILFWTNQNNKKPYQTVLDRKSILNFFNNIHPLKNQLLRIFKNYELPPEMSFISLVENKFFTSDNYSYSIVNKKSTATGIYQILKDTGMRFGLMVDRNQKIGEVPSLKDERLYFYPASCSVANMMHNYANNFQSDATLAFLAYRFGESKAASILECSRTSENKTQCDRRHCTLKTCSEYLKKIKNSNMKYTQIAKYNILPIEISNWINQILAAYFISQDLKGHGFEINKFKPSPEEKVLVPQNGFISNLKCRQIVTGFE